jgi:hypothetical protein
MRPSEIAAGVGVVCLLLALLTWLLVRAIATDVAGYSTTLRIFDDFAPAEASLDRDVLQARAGMLTDYDPLVRSSEEIAAAVLQLRAQAVSEGRDTGPVDRLAAATKIEEKLTERFKSDNALLRNSLSYVGHLSTSPGFNDRNLRLGRWLRPFSNLLSISLRVRSRPSKSVFSSLRSSLRFKRTKEPLRLSSLTLASSRFFFPRSMTLSRDCSPFTPDRLGRRRGRSSRACTSPRNPRRNGFAYFSTRRRFYLRSRSSISEDG